MKLILATLAVFTLAITALHAADTIKVISPSEVQRNGVNVGNVASFVATNPQFAAEVQAALEVWQRDLIASTSAAVTDAATKQAAAETRLKELISGAKIALAKRTSAERVAAAAEMLKAVETSDAQRKDAELAEQIAKLQAERAALSK